MISLTLQKREFMLFIGVLWGKIYVHTPMEDLKIVIGKNLAALRKKKKMTQIELAEHFNCSDKAVSKWEQGATTPDIETLKMLCDFYGVTLDYLTKEENISKPEINTKREKTILVNQITSTVLVISFVWMIATIWFVYPIVFLKNPNSYWLAFVWAVPASMLVLVFFNIVYFKRRKIITFIALSVFIWTILTCVFLHFFFFTGEGARLGLIFVLGIPIEITLILWFMLKKKVA